MGVRTTTSPDDTPDVNGAPGGCNHEAETERPAFRPRVVIPQAMQPITDAKHVAAADSEIDDAELVIGVTVQASSRAYPLNMLTGPRREIINEHGRIEESFTKDQPAYDYLRDEPEFQELMRILRDDLAKQLKRVRQMERNGELAPAPGVDLPGL